LSVLEQAAEYQKAQKVTVGERRNFDTCVFEEKGVDKIFDKTGEVDMCIPFWKYKQNMLTLDPKAEHAQIRRDFDAIVSDPDQDAIFRRGQWLVPSFEGVMRMTGTAREETVSTKRQQTIKNADDLQEFKGSGMAAIATSLQQVQSRGKLGLRLPDEPEPDVTPVDAPRHATLDNVVIDRCRKEAWWLTVPLENLCRQRLLP
jgi:hypothetical protein